ncbi:MAG TPA: hypothetical protein O0X25_03400 [Methanocorpusculum sp.]|nr:hypothetical protein [Methanocorpusculum sp.]HJJ40254.1 hypothetical protein [Methanocorpusculum sp.]HJJ49643.1 hypothetical protein [Methanocorpusculum sp.]HJJ57787.1 hypothetical protein [Methanocorpusculum sp.]HJJ95799.1 hypothetical protein [Methanocorpusculum sp.]
MEPKANPDDIRVDAAVIEYMDEGGGDYRISTTCSGPVLMSVKVKPPKDSDIAIRAGNHIIYISRYQLEWITEITMRMVPRYFVSPDNYAL